jgi:tRNA threonylcarbamoyladenosine biosynthesis protein TsaE
MEIIIKDKRNIQSAVKQILKAAAPKKIFAFYGPMGSGKTTIIKEVCKALGAVDIVNSPTFTLVNEYRTSDGDSLFHIDLYRIRQPEEVYDFGIEEYLAGNNFCFLEWPDIIKDMLPPDIVTIRLSVGEFEERRLVIS